MALLESLLLARKASRRADPPGPGRIHSMRSILGLKDDRIGPIEQLLTTYPDIALCKVGLQRLYFLNKPEYIQECLVTRHKSMHKDPYYFFLKLILGNGLLTSEESFHLKQRRMIQPAFHKERVQGYGEVMVEEADGMARSWRDGQEVDMATEMMGIALAIVGRTLFSCDVRHEAARVAHALETILDQDQRFMAPWGGILAKLPLPATLRFNRALKELDDVLYEMIETHERQGDLGDVLSMLLAAEDEDDGERMNRKQARDEALTLFLAGHETTAIALTWCWYCLSQNPEAMERLQAEVDEVFGDRENIGPADYPRLRYTRAVFAETMRLYPPAYMMGRQAIEDTQIGEYDIPKGSIVIVAPYVTQRDERYWPDATAFRPERWDDGSAEKRHKFAYFPFGGGKRLCVGEPFAWMEGVLVMARLARDWSAALRPGFEAGLAPKVTLRPKDGMPMILRKRVRQG